MKRSNRLVLALFALALGVIGVAAQTASKEIDSPYIIYAKAGRVNYVAGSVTRQRNAGDLREVLAVRDNLEAGEAVRTGVYGRVEVLLNPGSYLRANSNTEFAMVSNDLDNVRLRINKGSFLLEIMGPEVLDLALTFETPHTTVSILKRGIYRFNVDANNSNIVVQKGRAEVGSTLVKGDNKQITVGNGTATLAKFDKKMRDGFDEWSNERSATLAAINGRITDDDIRNSLANASFGNFNRFGSLAGVWVWDSFRGCYTFLPYSRSSWNSPYGWSYYSGMDYDTFLWYCNQPRRNNPPPSGVAPNPSAGRQGQVSVSETGNTASPRVDRTPGPKGNSDNNGSGRVSNGGGDRSGGRAGREDRSDRSLVIKREVYSSDRYSDSSSDTYSSPRSGSSSSSSNSGSVTVAPASSPASSSSDRSGGGGGKKPNDQ